jgi:hypothetical protein
MEGAQRMEGRRSRRSNPALLQFGRFSTIGLPWRRLVWACLRVRGQGMDARRIPFVTRSGA